MDRYYTIFTFEVYDVADGSLFHLSVIGVLKIAFGFIDSCKCLREVLFEYFLVYRFGKKPERLDFKKFFEIAFVI